MRSCRTPLVVLLCTAVWLVVAAFWHVASGPRRFDCIVMGKLEQVETVLFYLTLEDEDYAGPQSTLTFSHRSFTFKF